MDTKWMGHCIWYALDHFNWTKISMCSMSLTRQMQCNITCLYFAARGSVQYMHLTTTHVLARSSIWDRYENIHHQLHFGFSRWDFPWFLVSLWVHERKNILAFSEKGVKKRAQRIIDFIFISFDRNPPLTFSRILCDIVSSNLISWEKKWSAK